MHELSLCRSIYSIVDRARVGRPVESVQVRVGHLRQVVPETLSWCWGVVVEDTPIAGSRLDVEHVPIELHCQECGCRTTALERLILVCAGCGSGSVTVLRGEEMLVTSVQLGGEDDGQVPPA